MCILSLDTRVKAPAASAPEWLQDVGSGLEHRLLWPCRAIDKARVLNMIDYWVIVDKQVRGICRNRFLIANVCLLQCLHI